MLTLICILLLSWTSNALAEKLKEKKSRNTRGGGGEGKTGAGGGEENTAEGVGNRSRANSSGSFGSLDSVGEEPANVNPKGSDDLDNLDWVSDYDVGDGAAKTAREHRSKGDYLAHFKVRFSSSFVACVLGRIVLWGIEIRTDWWPG